MNKLIILVILIFIIFVHEYKRGEDGRQKPEQNGEVFKAWHSRKGEGSPKEEVKNESFNFLQNTYSLVISLPDMSLELFNKISNENTSIDRGKRNYIVWTQQYKQDLLHILTSPFLQHVKNMCDVEERRGFMRNLLSTYLTSQTTDLVEGLVFGGGKTLEKTFKNEVREVGLSHVLSASGANVSLVLLINSDYIRKKFGSFFTTIISCTAVVGYLTTAGCAPPLVRATITVFLALLGHSLWKRKLSQGWLLFVTSAGMVCLSPQYLTNISFQLSVAASVGILCVAKFFPETSREYIDLSISTLKSNIYHSRSNTANFTRVPSGMRYLWKSLRQWISATLLTTLAIQFLTLPVVLFSFRELSILAVVSNVAIVWLIPLIVLTSLLMLACVALHFSPLAYLLGQITELFARSFVRTVEILGSVDNSVVKFTPTQGGCFLLICLGCILTLLFINSSGKWAKNRYEGCLR